MRLAGLQAGAALCVAVTGVLVGYTIRGARADGIPIASPLVYSGILEDAGGPVDEGTVPIAVTLYDGPGMDAANVCGLAPSQVDFAGKRGRFEIVLAPDCASAIEGTPDLWVEVHVAGVPQLPRPKLTAVPYAIEARRASAASGALAEQLAALEQQVAALATDTTFAGYTEKVFTGKIGGYAAAKQACIDDLKLGPTAHLCMSEEIVRFLAAGGVLQPPPAPSKRAWFASGTYAQIAGGGQAISDCNNFTSDQSAVYGVAWDGNIGGLACSTAANLACCE